MTTKTNSLPSLLGSATVPMTVEQSQTFTSCFIHETTTRAAFDRDTAEKMGPIGSILFARLAWGDVRVTRELALWCAILSDGVPGKIVLWAWTLRKLYEVCHNQQLTISDWTNVFPLGVPTPEEYTRVWDAQKVQGIPDNALDNHSNWT